MLVMERGAKQKMGGNEAMVSWDHQGPVATFSLGTRAQSEIPAWIGKGQVAPHWC